MLFDPDGWLSDPDGWDFFSCFFVFDDFFLYFCIV